MNRMIKVELSNNYVVVYSNDYEFHVRGFRWCCKSVSYQGAWLSKTDKKLILRKCVLDNDRTVLHDVIIDIKDSDFVVGIIPGQTISAELQKPKTVKIQSGTFPGPEGKWISVACDHLLYCCKYVRYNRSPAKLELFECSPEGSFAAIELSEGDIVIGLEPGNSLSERTAQIPALKPIILFKVNSESPYGPVYVVALDMASAFKAAEILLKNETNDLGDPVGDPVGGPKILSIERLVSSNRLVIVNE